MNGQEVQEVVISGTRDGLGIRIVGGKNVASSDESEFGIFVKEVIKNSLAARDGMSHIRHSQLAIFCSSCYILEMVVLFKSPR